MSKLTDNYFVLKKNPSLLDTFAFIASFFVHLSVYTIALIGIDRYLRIKHYVDFKALWTTRVVSGFVFLDIFLSLLQAILKLVGLLSAKQNIVTPSYFAIDGVIISRMTFLQILTIRTSKLYGMSLELLLQRAQTKRLQG